MQPARIAAAVLLVAAAGCLDPEPPPPDLDNLRLQIAWANGYRKVEVSLPQIPCTGTERGFLGEEGVECESASWTLAVDGTAFATTPLKCTAAHEGLFGPVEKHCAGGRASAALPELASEDVEIVAATGAKRVRRVLRRVRRTYTWTEQAPFRGPSQPGIVRIEEGLALGGGMFAVSFTRPDGAPVRGSVQRPRPDPRELELSLVSGDHIDGIYAGRVEAYTSQDDVWIAVPIEGTLTVAD